MTRIYFDTEFTGLHQKTTLISIGCVAEDGQQFYAELIDFDESQVDDWLRENVIRHLLTGGHGGGLPAEVKFAFGSKRTISLALSMWLSQWESVEI